MIFITFKRNNYKHNTPLKKATAVKPEENRNMHRDNIVEFPSNHPHKFTKSINLPIFLIFHLFNHKTSIEFTVKLRGHLLVTYASLEAGWMRAELYEFV